MKTSAVTALSRLGSLASGSWEQALQEILCVAGEALGVKRFNYWRFRDQPRSIVCELGYLDDGGFERGFVLRELDALTYFNEIRKSDIVAIEDVEHDPRTATLLPYLHSRQVASLLDVPVRVGGSLAGIACAEHVGSPRSWTTQEREVMLALSQIIASQLESRARQLAERREQRITHLADVTAALAETLDRSRAAALSLQRALPEFGEMGVLITADDHDQWQHQSAHVSESGRQLLDELMQRVPPSSDGRGFIQRIMREQQTLLVPRVDLLTSYGFHRDELALIKALGIHSAMGLPMIVRGRLTGALAFASSSRTYDQEDIQFAEIFAQRVAVILENIRLYQQAQTAIRVRDEFLCLASHELRTPITALGLSAHALGRRAAELGTGAVVTLSDRIVRQTARLDRLAQRLLDTCQIDRSGIALDATTGNLAEVVREVTSTFQESARSVGSQITLSGDQSLIARFDPVRIDQVLGNLIDNAIKFGKGKPISVDVRKDHNAALIVVKDAGIGIPQAEQGLLFARYRRAGTAQGFGGLGLGLHVVREIVEAHHGEVWLESEPGKGTTVTVELPLEWAHLPA